MRIQATRTTYKGLSFDSATELDFYQRFEERVSRNEQTFTIWESSLTGEKIEYTPDFYETKDPKVWIEIKGVKDPLFSLREKLIKHYCKENGINYNILFLDNLSNSFVSEVKWHQLKKQRLLRAQNELKEIDHLLNKRKKLSDEEYEDLAHKLIDPAAKWPGLRKGPMVKKAKSFMKIRAKIRNHKDSIGVLKRLKNTQN